MFAQELAGQLSAAGRPCEGGWPGAFAGGRRRSMPTPWRCARQTLGSARFAYPSHSRAVELWLEEGLARQPLFFGLSTPQVPVPRQQSLAAGSCAVSCAWHSCYLSLAIPLIRQGLTLASFALLLARFGLAPLSQRVPLVRRPVALTRRALALSMRHSRSRHPSPGPAAACLPSILPKHAPL